MKIIALIFSVLAVASSAATSVTQFGITWTFNGDYQTGQYANGDYYVVAPSGLNIIGITPGSTIDTVVDPGRVMSGTMVNPAANLYLGGPSAQGFDSRSSGNFQASLNAGRPGGNALNSGNPLVVAAGSSVVTQISMLNPALGWGNRPMTSDAAVLTVVSSAPASGSFRPPYCGTNKTHYWNKSDLNYGILANYAAVTGTPTLATTAAYNARPWIEVVTNWEGNQSHPMNNQPAYGRDMAYQTGDALLRLNISGTNAEKETAYINLVQYGIDIYGSAVSGGEWGPDGGHNMGRKAIITLAAKALNDANILAWADKAQHNIFQDDLSAVMVDSTVEAVVPYTADGNVRAAFAPKSSTVTISNASPAVVTWPTTSATCTISNGNPAVITLAGHGFQSTRGVQFSTTGSLPSGITPGVTYWIQPESLGANSFTIGTEINVTALGSGSIVATTTAGSGTHTVTVGHGFQRSMPIVFSTTGALPSPLVAGTEYWIRHPGTSINTFTIGATAFNDDAVYFGGGDPTPINTTTAGSGTQTASFALTGKVVWASKGDWLDRAGSNFDVNYHGINMSAQTPLALGVMMLSGGKAAWNHANYFTLIDRDVTVSNYYGSPSNFAGRMWNAYRAGLDGPDTTQPTLSSGAVNASGNSVTFNFNESVTSGTGFTISPSGGAATLTYASGTGTTALTFNTSRTIQFDETLTRAYTPGTVADLAANALATISSGALTNNSTQGSGGGASPASNRRSISSILGGSF